MNESEHSLTTEANQDQPVKKVRGPYKTKSPSRGGARPNSGRKVGQGNKISGERLIEQLSATCGQPYEQQFAQNYMRAIIDNDKHVVCKYDQMILNKVIADRAEIDVTSAGEAIKTAFTFIPVELAEWRKNKSDE
jgi:hypothetical protein